MAGMDCANRELKASPMMKLPLARFILTKNSTTPDASRALTVGSVVEVLDPGSSVPHAAAIEAKTNRHESFRSIVFLQSLMNPRPRNDIGTLRQATEGTRSVARATLGVRATLCGGSGGPRGPAASGLPEVGAV